MSSGLAPLPSLANLLAPRSGLTKDQIAKNRRMAEILSQQAQDPNGAGGSMLGAIAQGIRGVRAGILEHQADQEEARQRKALSDAITGLPPAETPTAAIGRTLAPSAGPAGGSPPAISMQSQGPLNATAKSVYDGLVQRGMPSMVAAGMVGNIGAESNFRLNIADGRGEGSVGLIQARGPRLAALKEMGAQTGRDPFSLDNQLDHIVQEANGSEARAFDLAAQAKTPGEAAYILAKRYERPANWALAQSAGKRMGVAERAYQDFGGGQAARADMPAAGSAPVGMDAMGNSDGGYFIPPAAAPTAPPQPEPAFQPPAMSGSLEQAIGGPASRADPSVAGPVAPVAAEPEPGPAFDPTTSSPLIHNSLERAAASVEARMGQGAPTPDASPPASLMADPGQAAQPPAPAGFDPATVPLPPQRPADLMSQPGGSPQGASAIAQALSGAPLPPRRPAEFATPPADLPAPGAQPAMLQQPGATGFMVPPGPAFSPNGGQPDAMGREDAGVGEFSRTQAMGRLLAGGQGGAPAAAMMGRPEPQNGLERALAGLQDGFDTLTGSPPPDRRAQLAQALGAPPVSERSQRIAQMLTPDGRSAGTTTATVSDAAPGGRGPSPQQGEGGARPLLAQAPAAGGQGQAGVYSQQAAETARQQSLYAIANSEWATPEMRQIARDELNPKLTTHDAGDALIVLDPRGNLVRRIDKSKAADFGEVGRDAYGQPIMGFRNYGSQGVNVPQVPGSAATAGPPRDMAGNPIPQGVDPKVVREAQSKSYAEGTVPATTANVSDLRKEVLGLPSYKNLRQASPVYQSMLATAGTNTKASDLNLIYGLGKIMDPGSVVREGEMVMANNTQGIQERLNGMISALKGGAALTPQARQALMAEAHGRMQAYEGEFDADAKHYRGIAGRSRMAAEDVVPSFEASKPWTVPQASGAGGAPSGAVEMLRRDPSLRDQYDAKYGRGAADRALGGR